MKVKNFIKRGLAGLLSLLILLGDVGSPGILSAWAEETATEIVETYIPPEAADTAQAAAIAADEALASAAEADVSEEDPAAGTDASGGPTTTTTNEINTSSEEGTQQQTEGSAGSGESVSADSAGSGTGLEGAATGESVSADPESVTDTETDAGEIQDAPEGNAAQQSVTGQSQPADEAAEEEKEPAALSVSALTADARYATANVSAMNYSVSIAGGTAPYQVHFTVQNSGALCFEHRVELAAPGNAEFSYIPAASGSHDIAVTVVDAQYTTLNQWASMPVSSGETDDYDTAVSHVALSGDWAADVMNIAVSQIGVGEKQHNFIIDENNTYHYYSMYADWYGEPYADWSAIFAAYCLNKAGVPEGAIPVDKDAEKMLAAVTGKGLYKAAAEYEPVIGDLAFLSENRVGIVSVAGNGEVYIIAGDSGSQVRQLVMQMTDPAILGYVSLSEAKAAYEAGGADEQQPQQGAEPEAEPETEENTADAAVIPENVDISVYPAASAVGDTVTFSADIPADIDPDSLIYSWQLSPDGAEWVEMGSTDVPSYTVQTSARHYLNYIRVAVSADPGYVKPEPAQTEFVEPEAGEAVPEESGSENENQSEPVQDTQTIAPAQTQPIAAQAARNIRRISYSADNSSAQTSSGGIMLTAIEYDNAIFWNPYGSNTYSEDGVVIVAAGSDSNAGTQIKPVLSLAKAIELAHADGANKTIVCMNLYNSYGDVSMESTASAVSLLGYDGGGEGEAAAHEGLFISSKSGVLVVQNLHTDSSATGAVIEANGGEIYLQSGNNIPGNIYINKLSTNYLPITASVANAANSSKYIIDFDPDYVGTVGIAKGGLEANSQYLQLSQTLIDRGWSFKELNGNTYAHIPPHYEAVFIDGLNGSDANLGNSEEFPVRTFAQAKALMEANGISTLYVMGTVALTAGNAGEHLLLPEGAKAVRHVSCTGAMFEISGGEHTVSFTVNGGLESGTDAAGSPSYTAYDAAIFNVTGGKLTVSASANISGAAGCAITMSGGSLDLSACNNNITANGIVKGSAADIVLGGSSLDGGSMPVADVTVSGSFTADGATLSSTAANTLIVSGTAVIKNCTVANGSGSIKSGSGSLTVESTYLAVIEAAGVLNVKNSKVTTINNAGSATTIDAVSVSTLNSAGAVKVLNGSAVSNSLSASGSSLEISGSTVGSESAAATVTAGGDVSITASQVHAPISAQGAVGISINSAVSGTVDADGNVTVDASTVSGKISGSAVEIENASTVADIEAGSTVTVTSSTAGAIDARGDAIITSSQLNGALSTGGKLSMSDSKTKSNVTASGAAEISSSTIESTLTVTGMTSLSGSTVTTANLGDSTITGTAITTLTATGDTELVSGSVSTLISEGNVTAKDGTVTKLELRGDSAYLLTGDTYTASVPDIALSGSGAYIKLQGEAADSSITLTIAREYDGRLVVEGVDDYDASTQLSKYKRAEGSTDIYKLLGEGRNIVIEGPNGVYVSTQYPGEPGTDGYGTQVNNPAQSFEEAVAILNAHPEFARIINVIGTVTITSSDSLTIRGETVTVVPYSDAEHPAVSTLIRIDSGASFSASNANFDGAGLADASTLFDVAGSITLSGSPSLSNADTVIKNSGTSSLGSSVISAEAGGTGISLSAGSVRGSNVKISVDGAGTGLDISGGSLELSDSSTAIDIGGNGTGVKMSGGTVSALGGSININGVGKGIAMSSGTATVSAGINVKNSGSLGVDIDGGTLTYSGTIYGTNAMDIAEATVNFNGGGTRNASGYSNMKSEGLVTLSGGTLNISGATISSLQQESGSTSIKSGTVYYMGMESGKLNSSGGSISNLSMNGGTTSVTAGSNNISTMTQNGGTTAISGGRVYSLTLNKGSVTVSGGSLDYSTVNGGLADSTLDIKGGAANSISQYGGIVTVSGGSVSYARLYRGTSSALLYANGGSITETSLLGAGSVLHTNGKCRLGDVKIGSGSSGRDSYIELSGPMTANSASDPVEISDIANANYHENYSVVIPKSGSGVDASDYLSCFEYDDRVEERFILAGGADEKATHIVLSFEGVFIDTENGDDANDGLSHANPVKTFARAGEVLKGRINSDPGALRVIYVVDKNNPNGPATATVRGADTLDMSGYSDSYVMPFHTSCDTLVKVPAGASFTVTSARIDGVGNNAAASTATVMDVAGSLSLNSAQLINARGTVLKLSGSAVLTNSSIYPYSSSRSSATSVKLNGGALDLNSSTVSYGRYGVDMSGGTLDIDSGSAIRYAYTGLKLSSGDVTLAGAVSGSSYTGIEMSGGTVTQSGSVNSNGSYYTGSSKGGVYMSGGEYKMTSGSINSNSGYSSGGGVTVAGGSFTASGGSISSNKTNASGGGIMISSGSAVLSNTNISYNYAAYYSATNGMGGGVCASGGTLSLTNCTVSYNRGGSGSSVSLLGGGIYAGAGASLTVSGTAVSNNSASSGGGLYMGGGTVSITGGSINSNTASSMGGGVYAGASGSMTISGAGINSNTAAGGNGGGVYWVCGNGGSISGGSLDGNKAPNGNGGGLYISGSSSSHSHGFSFTSIQNNSAANGGGVYNNCDTAVDLSAASAMSGNSASTAGGALYMAKGSVTLPSAMSSNTVSGNEGKGGAVYVGSGTLSGSSVNFSGSKAVNGLGGVIYVNSGTVSLPGSTLSTSNASASAKQGGAVYVVNGTVDLSGSSISGSKATEGSGGAVYLQSGSIDLTNATISGAASAATEGVDASGGAVYIKDGTAVMEGAKLSGSAETNGGAVCIMGGTADMDGAAITNSSAALGGGLYVGGGSVSMLKNGDTASSISGTASGEDAEGAAIYLESGELSFYGSASSSGDANTVFVGEKTSFKHKGGTIAGDVRTEGDYVITLPDAWVKGELTIVSNEHPLVIDPASTENGSNKFKINAHKDIFAEVIIVDGTMTVPAKLSQFTIDSSKNNNIINPSEVGDDIFGGASVDVYWDPTGTNGDDAHSGGSYVEAVKTFNRAMQLLATKGSASRIILCSTATALTSYDGNSYTDASGKAAALDWNAKIVRYYDPSGTNTFKGTMFSNVTSMSDIIISGEAHMSDGGVVSIDIKYIIKASSSLKLTNVELCYHDMLAYGLVLSNSDVELENCDIHDCEFSMSGYEGGVHTLFGNGTNLTMKNTDVYNCKIPEESNINTGIIGWSDHLVIIGGTFSNNESISDLFFCTSPETLKIDGARFENNLVGTSGNGTIIKSSVISSALSIIDACISNCVFVGNVSGSSTISVYHSNLEINGCTFENNTSGNSGGVINVSTSSSQNILTLSASIKNNVFNGNTSSSGNGGAIMLEKFAYGQTGLSVTEFSGNTFTNNTATGAGGALYVGEGVTFTNFSGNFFTNNTASGEGGAVYLSAAAEISNSTFIGNRANGGNGGAVCVPLSGPGMYAARATVGGGGDLTVTDSVFTGNESNGFGGAVFFGSEGATLSVSGSSFENNVSKEKSFDMSPGLGRGGGAICIEANMPSKIIIGSGCKFIGNSAAACGGALEIGRHNLTIAEDTEFINNTAGAYGGALFMAKVSSWDTTSLSGLKFTGNSAGSEGGAVYFSMYDVEIANSSFINNSVTGDSGVGGAIRVNGDTTIKDSTFTGNTATSNGGALYIKHETSNAKVTVTGSLFNNNSASTGGAIYSEMPMNNESAVTGSLTVSSSSFDGNSADSGAVYFVNDAIGVGSLFTVSFSDSAFTRNISDDAVIFIRAKSTVIDGCTFGNESAMAYPADKEAALSSGGNAAKYIVWAFYGLNISGSTFSGNYCSDSAVWSNAAGDGLTISDSHIDCNKAEYGLNAGGASQYISSLAISGSSFDGNSGIGAYLGGFADSTTTTATITNSSFSHNGGNGLYANCGNLYQSASDGTAGRRLEISGSVISFNGDSGLKLAGVSGHNGMTGLKNVTVEGNGSLSGTEYGGGIYVGEYVTIYLDSSVAIKNNKAENGGAIYWESDSDFTQDGEGAVLSGNEAVNGGAFYAEQPVTLGGFIVKNNKAVKGGGMYVDMPSISGIVTLKNDQNEHPTQFIGNTADYGGAIYIAPVANDANAKNYYVNLSQVSISGNSSTSDGGYSSGIYNEGSRLYMAGDNAAVEDNIFLNKSGRHIHLSSSLSDVVYNIAVNMDTDGGYGYGDVVVSPTANGTTNAAQYLRSTNAVVPGSVFAKGSCGTEHSEHTSVTATVDAIVLKSCIFVDGMKGSDSNDGSTPSKAFKTMEKAIEAAGSGNAVIYVCGTVTVTGSASWNNANDVAVEIRRYTGFNIGGGDNSDDYGQAFICKEDMISVAEGASLTLGETVEVVAGSHNASDTISATGSIFNVSGTLVLPNAVSIEANYSSANGSAIKVNEGGAVTVQGAVTISDCSGSNGGGIYNEGRVNITSGSLTVSGCEASVNGASVYNNGVFRVDAAAAFNADGEFYIARDKFLTVGSSFAKINDGMSALFIDIEAPVDQRVYVSYETAFSDESAEEAKYALSPSITASFLRESGAENISLILSQSNIVYVGDTVINDKLTEGLSADYPFTSLKAAYEYLAGKGGGLIYIVDTINVTAGMTVGSGSYDDSSETITLSDGGVSIRRYSKPTSFTNTTSQSFTAQSNTGALFSVTSGSLTLDGVVLDGHNYAITSAGEKTQFTIAPAVSADAALVAVSGTGSLILTNGASLVSNTSSNKGDAISHSGAEVSLSGESVNVEGSVYLAKDEFVTVTDPSLSPAAKLILELDDAYDGRVIAQYTPGDDTAPDGGETSKYVLPESVAEYYKLAVDAEDDTVILRTNRAVYVDGVAGDDTNAGTPDSPIRTLRRAYELLSGYGGSIYIVDTVSIEGGADISLSSTQYYDGNTVTIQSGSVEIVRYSKPSAAPKGYSRESFFSGSAGNGENASLIAVKSGSSLTLGNITLDGHNAARSGSSTTAAPAVEANGPAVYVRGSLVLDGAELKNNTNSYSKGGAVLVAASGSVLMRGGAALSGNADADGANGVFLTGKLDIGGSVSFAEDQWVYENNSHIDVSASFSGIIPVELAEQDVDSGKVIASYAAGLKPNAASFAITGANQQKAQALNISKTVAGQDVILKASYAVSYKLTNGLEKAADAPSMAADYEEFNTGIKAESGYVLPKSITITVTPLEYVRNEKGEFEARDGDPVTLNSGLDYSYDPADGSIKVFNDKVTGKLEISAEGIKVHLISYSYEIPGSVQPAGDNPTSVLNAEGFSASFYPAAGYENLSVKSITVGGNDLNETNYTAVYDVQNEELSLSVGSGLVTGNVTVTVSAQLKQYNIGEQIDGVTMELPGKIAHGAALEATELVLENQDAYEMPESVTVYVGSRELNAGEYTYKDGKLSIIEGVVDGDVRITGTAKIKEFKVEYALSPAGTLVQADNAPAKVNYGAELATGIMLTNPVNYALPKAVTVTMGGKEFTNFAYDAANGTIAIAEGKITGDIVISAEARDVYTVEYVYDGNHVTAGSANPGTVIELEALSAGFTPKPGYQIDSITVTLNETELTEGVSRSGDSISIAGGVINAGPVKITVVSSLKQYAITEGVGNASVNDVTDSEPVTVPDGTAGQPEHKVGHGEELKLKILPDDENGYTYPDSVTVTINGQQETVTAIEDGEIAEGITYNKSSGEVTIPDGFVEGPVSITGNAKLKTYTVETALDNLTVTGTTNITTADGKYTVSHGSPAGDAVITIDDTVTGYDLPETVTVTIGGTKYENVGAEGGISGISYNKSTGAITIPDEMVTGNITVQAGGVLEQYKVVYKFSSNNGTAKKGSTDVTNGDTVNYHAAYSSVISANTGYRITEVKVTTAGTTEALYDNQNLEQTEATGIITGAKTDNGDYTRVALNIGTGVVTGELTVTVTLAKRQYTVTNNVEHSDIDDDDTPDKVTVTDGGEDVVITIEPEDGYDPPAKDDLVIIVKDPDDEDNKGEPLPEDSYTYYPETGEIVITKPEVITGPIEISGDIRKEVYDVSFDFEPDAAAGTAKVGNEDVTAGDKVEYNTAYSAVISAAKGYKIDSIAVRRVDEERNTSATLTKGTGFDYSGTKTDNGDYTSYTLSVNASGHTGDILVVINASRRTYTITEDVDDATVTKDNETVPETPTDPDATVTGPKVTDGEDITVTVVPGEDHSYPDEITVTIKDPDDPGEDKTVTVEKGGKDEETGIEYKDDGTVTIPGDVITGPVEISGEALKKFDVDVTIEPVKDANGNADYQRTDDIKDVTVTGETGENVAVETHSHELTITPETGYTIVSITVANGSETENIPVKESGTADSGYSYDKTTGKLRVSEVKGDITVTVNTERTRYDVEYQLKKDSEDTAKLKVSAGYTEEGGNVPIHGEDFTTYIEGIDNTITLPDSIKVYVDGEELPAQDDEGNSNYTYISSGTDAGKIVIPGDKVTGKVLISAVGIESFTAEYDITLTASETFVSGTSEVKLDLVAEDSKKAVSLARLQGKSFKVTSVTMPKGITLADKEAVEDVKTTAGSSYANANFAITAGSTDLYDVQNAGAWFSFTAASSSPELTFTIHNANAITTADDAGTVVVKLESDIGDEITLNITIKRSPSQLNVTVPLVLVMKTNIDGGSVENLGSYAISNKSSMDVKLTKAEVADTSDIMAKSDTDSFTGVDQFYVGVQTGQTIKAQTGTFNPITKLATSPLSFVTADDDSMGLHMATVTYTVAIPE